MTETYEEVDRWGLSEFPYELSEEHMDALHEVLPRGYWVAFDYSADDRAAVALLKHEDY